MLQHHATTLLVRTRGEAGVTNQEVAEAWAANRPASTSTLSTDGVTLKSYNHQIGDTDDSGKILMCCHYSKTTSKQCSTVRGFADRVVECPDHGRPDLHRRAG